MSLFIIISIILQYMYDKGKEQLEAKIDEELEIITDAAYNMVAVADQSMQMHLQTLSQKGLFLIKTKYYNESLSQEEP